MNSKQLRAIKIRRISIIRLESRPPSDMTPEQVKREIASINTQIERIKNEQGLAAA